MQYIHALNDGESCIDHRRELATEQDDVSLGHVGLEESHIFEEILRFLLYFGWGYTKPVEIGSNQILAGRFHLTFLNDIVPVLSFP
jgi:hypothetical protein